MQRNPSLRLLLLPLACELQTKGNHVQETGFCLCRRCSREWSCPFCGECNEEDIRTLSSSGTQTSSTHTMSATTAPSRRAAREPSNSMFSDRLRSCVPAPKKSASPVGKFARSMVRSVRRSGTKRRRDFTTTWMEPRDVRFTHDRISHHFYNGEGVDDTIDKILDGRLAPSAFPPIY